LCQLLNGLSWPSDESLKAGKLQELHQKRPLETSGKQGIFVYVTSNKPNSVFRFCLGCVVC
jgi:AMMECR1 domain-containing protein